MTHISIAGRLMAALPDHNDPLTGAGGPEPIMTHSTTRLGGIAQHPKRLALLTIALVAFLFFISPHAAKADSYYNVDACYNNTLTWGSWNDWEGGTDGNGQSSVPGCGSGYGQAALLEASEDDSGLAGHGYDHLTWFAYAPTGTTLSGVSGNSANFYATEGTQAGWAVDNTGGRSGFFTTNGTESVITNDPGVTPDCANPGSGTCNDQNAYNFTNAGLPGGTQGIALAISTNECGLFTNGCTNADIAARAQFNSVTVDDPYDSPAVSATGASFNQSQWYSAAKLGGGSVSAGMSASDPGGVCDTWIQLSGPSGTIASTGNVGAEPASHQGDGSFDINLGTTNPSAPCSTSGSQTLSVSSGTIGAAAPGTYEFDAIAQNPSNVNNNDLSDNTQVAQINIDNTVPTISISGGTGQWSSNNDQTYSVQANTAGPAGIASISCTGAGLPAGGQTWNTDSASIPESANGDDAISCTALTNAGVSSSSVGTEGTARNILIDTAAPALGIDNDSPTTHADGLIGDWVDPATDGSAETVDVYATAGVSGITGTTSGTGTIDQWSTTGTPVTSGISTQASLDNTFSGEQVSKATIAGNTYGMPACTVTDLSDPTTTDGSTYTTYDAATGSSAIGNAAATPSIDADSKYVEWQIPFTANGHYQLDCSVTNGAGVTSTLGTQNIEVDSTSSADLQTAAADATHDDPTSLVDATGGNPATGGFDSTASQAAALWSGDPLTLSYQPAEAVSNDSTASNWPATADLTDSSEVDPITQTTCVPGGDASGEQTSNTTASSIGGANPTEAAANSITIGDTNYSPQADNQPATQTPANNGNDQVVCTETNAAGTTSDPTTYYLNIDQQTPTVAYSQPSGDTGGQGSSAASVDMTPAALSARTGLPQREFGLAPLTATVPATPNNPIPATGHLAGAGPAEFKLNHNSSSTTTGVQYSDTATQVNATPSEQTTMSGVFGEYCSDTNQTEPGSGGDVPQPYGDGAVLASGGTTATLDVPETGDANDAVTGIHSLGCYAKDSSTFLGSDAVGAFAGSGSQRTNYPWTGTTTVGGPLDPSAPARSYNYTVNIDNVSPATIGWGIVNQGETVTNPDPYSYSAATWYQDEATLTATAQGVGNDLSDIDAIVCGVNDPSFGQPNSTYTNPVTNQPVPYYDYTLDGAAFERPTDANNNYTVEIPVQDTNGSGTYYVSCFAVSGSGVNGTVTTTEVNLQPSSSTPGACTQFCPTPDPTLDIPPSGIGPIPGGQQWHTQAVQVPVVAETPAGSAPVESITCDSPPATLDGDTTNPNAVDNGDGTITYPNPSGTNSNNESITVTVGPPTQGVAEPPLECYATDSAGVNHTLGSYQVNVDDSAPTGYFVKPNKSDPRKVTLYATDNNGSGIGKVVLQFIDSAGKATNLPLTSNTTGDGDYTAELPTDDQEAKGSYTLQAIVTDVAGNVTNPPIANWENGTPANVTYPLLSSATMIDALGAGTTAPLLPGDKGTASTKVPETKKVRVKVHGKWVTKTVKVYKTVRIREKAKTAGHKTKWVTKKVLQYKTVKASAKVLLANVNRPVKLAYAGKSTADGIVTTGSGVPVVGGTVDITQKVDGTTKQLGTATTNDAGRWVYHVPAGPSRELDFEYTGTAVIDAATGSAGAETVNGKVTLRAARAVKVGQALVLKGKLSGGFIPARGVALRVYFTEKGARGTGDYAATYHTTKTGAFTIKEPSRASARGRTYTFWVKVVTPTPWPFNGATSKKVTVSFH